MRRLMACAIVTTALASGCGVSDPPEGFSVAWIVNGCSPVDGPAVELYLGESVPTDATHPTYPHIRIAIDPAVEALSGNRFTSHDSPPAIFVAQRCGDSTHCVSATDVTVEFDHTESALVEHSGYLQMTFSDGSSIEGSFRAEVYSLLILCG